MLVRRSVAYAPRRSVLKYSQQWHIRSRPLSSSSSSSTSIPSSSTSASSEAVLSSITSELDRRGPRIDLHASQVTILSGPKEFYATLKEKIRGARRRIFLATLYVGREEHELMEELRAALANNPELQVSILTDALRGTRESPGASCATLLASLAVDFPDRVEVLMYHTSNLRGLRKRMIPVRINEGWGLQHMKLYGVDDELILSGANLSRDYFTNRQDRYHVFASRAVTKYYHAVYTALAQLCWRIEPQNRPPFWNASWPERRSLATNNAIPSPLRSKRGFDAATRAVFEPLLRPAAADTGPVASELPPTDTTLYPLLVLPRAANSELPVLRQLLAQAYPPGSRYLFTAGYFNPHPAVTQGLLALASGTAAVQGTVLTASPWANGFFGSRGVSGLLPPAYTLLARRFLQAADAQTAGAVRLREWRCGTVGRPHGWTYHAKGLWITLGGEQGQEAAEEAAVSEKAAAAAVSEKTAAAADGKTGGSASAGPALTLLGSSNYTVRSYGLDTEAGALLVTRDRGLQRRLRAEADNLLQHSRQVEVADLDAKERRAGPLVRLAMAAVALLGGSL